MRHRIDGDRNRMLRSTFDGWSPVEGLLDLFGIEPPEWESVGEPVYVPGAAVKRGLP